MLIAREKRKSNIAEYVIYMWHVEDMIRALNFDLDKIKIHIVDGFKVDEAQSREVLEWYESMIHMMHEQGVTQSGHLSLTMNTINELEELHQKLLKAPKYSDYMRLYFHAKPNIILFKSKSPDNGASDILTCFNALYSMLLMKLSGKEVNPQTAESMETFSNLLAGLSSLYKEVTDGKLDI
jgi:hypothetical protein